jgi:hypothetical protein
MSLSSFLKDRLREIATGEMPPLTRAQRKRGFQYGRLQRFHADEDGKISFVSVFTVLAIVLFIGLIMNTTVSVKEKTEMQNAADVATYTSNLWRARAMNAITATNHLMGEATSVLVLVDGFGGKLLESTDGPIASEEFEKLNGELKGNRESWVTVEPIKGSGSTDTLLNKISELDKQLVTTLVDAMIEDNGKATAGAALYDSRVRLKKLANQIFTLKKLLNKALKVVNILAEFPPTKGYAKPVQNGLVLTHVALSTQLLPIIQEWYTLELVENTVRLVQPAKITKGIESGLLPALTAYCDNLAKSESGVTAWQRGLSQNLEQIRVDHKLFSLEIIPKVVDLRLPVMQENPPKTEPPKAPKESNFDIPPRGWDGGFLSKTEIEGIFREVARWFEPLQGAVGEVKNIVEPIIDAYENAKNSTGPLGDFVGEVADFMGMSDELVDGFNSLFDLMDQFEKARKLGEERDKGSDKNPCINQNSDKRYRIEKFYWDDERYSQWTRATYPYVDQHRRKIVDVAKKIAKHSNFATYYVNYTNRYTLYRAYSLRKVETDKSGKPKADLNPLKKLLSQLAKDFDAALEPVDDMVDSGPAPFEAFENRVFKEILPVAKGLVANEQVREWIDKAEALDDNIRSAGQNAIASWNQDFDISREDLQALAEQIERINRIAELLSLLEELIDQFEIPRPHMWVMQQMEGRNKGNEPWVNDSPVADKLFTVSSSVKRAGQQIFMSPVFFTQHLSGQRECRAKSMLYNANGRGVGVRSNSETERSNYQPNTGWDTLNWQVPTRASEWGSVLLDGLQQSASSIKWHSLLIPHK